MGVLCFTYGSSVHLLFGGCPWCSPVVLEDLTHHPVEGTMTVISNKDHVLLSVDDKHTSMHIFKNNTQPYITA